MGSLFRKKIYHTELGICEKPDLEFTEDIFNFEKPFTMMLRKGKEEVYRLVATSHIGGEGTGVK